MSRAAAPAVAAFERRPEPFADAVGALEQRADDGKAFVFAPRSLPIDLQVDA